MIARRGSADALTPDEWEYVDAITAVIAEMQAQGRTIVYGMTSPARPWHS